MELEGWDACAGGLGGQQEHASPGMVNPWDRQGVGRRFKHRAAVSSRRDAVRLQAAPKEAEHSRSVQGLPESAPRGQAGDLCEGAA